MNRRTLRALMALLLTILVSSLLMAGCAPKQGLRPLAVEAVVVDVGVGSPIPVEIVASGTWPDLCAQLASVESHIDADNIEVTLLASPQQPDCPPDAMGVPFRVAVPLNAVELPEGRYTITVNGMATTFDWPTP